MIARKYALWEVARWEKLGFYVTVDDERIVYDEEFHGPNGVRFVVIMRAGQTLAQVVAAKRYLRMSRDTVEPIMRGEMERCPNCKMTEEEVGFYLEGRSAFHMICNGCNHAWRSDLYHDPKFYQGET